MDGGTRAGVDIRVEAPVGGTVIVRVSGDVDLPAVPTVRGCVDDRPEDTRAVVVDLSEVEFIGAAGLSALVHVSATAARRGLRWALVCPSVVSRPMRMTGLDAALPVCANLVEALALVTRPGERLTPSS